MTEDQPKRKVGRPRNSKSMIGNVGDYTSQNIARFWSKVNKNGSIPANCPELGQCWEWLGGQNGKGYGQIRINYTQMGTHQVAWELVNGKIPDGLFVLHKCDNRTCVNPAHLSLGTPLDNTRDMIQKNRRRIDTDFSTGTKRHHITASEISELKSRFSKGESLTSLARNFNIARETVSNILKGRTRSKKNSRPI